MSGDVTLGRALALHRGQLGLDFTGAALAMGVSRSTYTAYETDARRLSPDTLRVIAKFLGVPVEDTLELFGATCILQARRALLGDDLVARRKTGYITRARANAKEGMEVLRRVYFDPDLESDGDAEDAVSALDEELIGGSEAPSRAGAFAAPEAPATVDWAGGVPRVAAEASAAPREASTKGPKKSKKSKNAKKSKRPKDSASSKKPKKTKKSKKTKRAKKSEKRKNSKKSKRASA